MLFAFFFFFAFFNSKFWFASSITEYVYNLDSLFYS